MISFVGNSAWAKSIGQSVERVARSSSTVLISGPSGTGKELIARAIHEHSPRKAGPFVVVDCTWIPSNLFPSQLFGHVKGAFSGADCDTLGCFRAADKGTIFLDEIGELELDLQAQLLRVIQERVVTPVGSHKGVPIDTRIVAATNRNLAREVHAGRFRLDLFYRLNVVTLNTAALRQRPDDIAPIARHILDRLAVESGGRPKRLTSGALKLLEGLPWPGNVRQLQNLLEQAVVFLNDEELTADYLAAVLDAKESPEAEAAMFPGGGASLDAPQHSHRIPAAHDAWPSLAETECRAIHAALERSGYNQSAAARLLKVDRRLLARKAVKHGILSSRLLDKDLL